MKLWITGFFIGDITNDEASRLRAELSKHQEYAIAVDDGKEMIVVLKEAYDN